MAVLLKEPTALPGEAYSPPSRTGTESLPRHAGGVLRLLLAWLPRSGEFALGVVLTLVGMLLRAMLAVCVLVAPFIGLVLVVLLFGLLIEGFGLLLRAAGLLH